MKAEINKIYNKQEWSEKTFGRACPQVLYLVTQNRNYTRYKISAYGTPFPSAV